MSNQAKKSPAWFLVVSWLIVGVPAAWGVTQTIKASLTLFEPPKAATSPAATPPPTAPTATPAPAAAPAGAPASPR